MQPATCIECHHADAVEAENCDRCHLEVVALREIEAEDDPTSMLGVDCIACHAPIEDEHSRDAVQEACAECHDEDEGIDFEVWLHRTDATLEAVEVRLRQSAGAGARRIRRELQALQRAGPFHHAAAVESAAAHWLEAPAADDE